LDSTIKGRGLPLTRRGRTIESEDFTHDAILSVGGDFGSNEERFSYAQGLVGLLNKHVEGKSNVGK
jgi:hypothetical protein